MQFIPMVSGLILGSYMSSRLVRRWPTARIIAVGFGIMTLAVAFNLLQAVLFDAIILLTIAQLVMYAFGAAMVMPGITILALDCFPEHRGAAASMQGFSQMMTNAGVAGIAVPLQHTQRLHFVLGQALFLLLALGLWFLSGRGSDAK